MKSNTSQTVCQKSFQTVFVGVRVVIKRKASCICCVINHTATEMYVTRSKNKLGCLNVRTAAVCRTYIPTYIG
jgi:hypothetical protein